MQTGVPFTDGIKTLHFDEIDSTQKYVKNEFDKLPRDKLTVVSADYQTAGVGKGDRKWVAAAGKSVLVTFAFHFPTSLDDEFVNKNAKNVSHVLALSAVKVLGGHTQPFGDAFRFELKWPNDIMLNRKKIGGILAEAVTSGEPGASRLGGMIVGIGLNINKTQDELVMISRPVWPAASLFSEFQLARRGTASEHSSTPFCVASIRDGLALMFFRDLQGLFEQGFETRFLRPVDDLQILKGEEIAFNKDDRKEGKRDDSQVLQGVFEGIDKDSFLKLRLPSGSLEVMVAGEMVPLSKQGRDDLVSLGTVSAVTIIGLAAFVPRFVDGSVCFRDCFRDVLQVLGVDMLVALSGRLSIRLPFTPVPITAQTLAINLSSLVVGPVRGAVSMAVFALMSLFSDQLKLHVGSPNASKASQGYVFGFILAAYIYGLPTTWGDQKAVGSIMVNSALASAATYVGGVIGLWYYGVRSPIQCGVLPFLPGDALKSLIAACLFTRYLAE